MGQKGPFYELYRIGTYTFAEYSVVWPEVGHTVTAAVIGKVRTRYDGDKFIIPDHTCVSVPTGSSEEAHYVTALLNSTLAQIIIRGYVVLHPSPHVLEHVAIPKFEAKNTLHRRLAELSLQTHKVKTSAKTETIIKTEKQIDQASAELWGIEANDLERIQKAFTEG